MPSNNVTPALVADGRGEKVWLPAGLAGRLHLAPEEVLEGRGGGGLARLDALEGPADLCKDDLLLLGQVATQAGPGQVVEGVGQPGDGRHELGAEVDAQLVDDDGLLRVGGAGEVDGAVALLVDPDVGRVEVADLARDGARVLVVGKGGRVDHVERRLDDVRAGVEGLAFGQLRLLGPHPEEELDLAVDLWG